MTEKALKPGIVLSHGSKQDKKRLFQNHILKACVAKSFLLLFFSKFPNVGGLELIPRVHFMLFILCVYVIYICLSYCFSTLSQFISQQGISHYQLSPFPCSVTFPSLVYSPIVSDLNSWNFALTSFLFVLPPVSISPISSCIATSLERTWDWASWDFHQRDSGGNWVWEGKTSTNSPAKGGLEMKGVTRHVEIWVHWGMWRVRCWRVQIPRPKCQR